VRNKNAMSLIKTQDVISNIDRILKFWDFIYYWCWRLTFNQIN
jgi:hypothetical protein